MSKLRGSRNGEIVYNSKDDLGMKWPDFKKKYEEYLNTSAFYVIRTPKTVNGKGDLIKLGISSVGSSEIIRRLSDYERYYDGDFRVLHLRVWYQYVKGTNQEGAPQERFELRTKRRMKELTTPAYGNEWFNRRDLKTLRNVLNEFDKENEDIQYVPPDRNRTRRVKEISTDTFVRIKYGKKLYIGVIYDISVKDKKPWFSVVFFDDKYEINVNDVGGYEKAEIKEGILNFEEWEDGNHKLAKELRVTWSRARNEYGLL